MSNPDHVAKLKQGVEAWNRWRDENPDVIPALAGADLSNREGSDFLGVRLDGANFSDAHLEEAILLGTHLEGAIFFKAHLERARFPNAYLEATYFFQAHLEGAHFGGAHLAGVDFTGAYLEGASFPDAHLEGAVFWDVHLEGATFSGARLEGARFRGARLGRAAFVRANLKGADFIGAHLEGANLFQANLERASLRRARLEGANVEGAQLARADLRSADLSNADLRFATGIRFDDTKILHTRLDPQPGTFWQRQWPFFIINPLTDPWSTLRRTYTGANFAITLIALLALLLPLVFQATVWRGVNEAQVIMRKVVAALKCEESVADAREGAEQVCLLDASEWLAVPKWLVGVTTSVAELKPCLAAECRSLPVLLLLLGWHRGAGLVILTACVLLYGGVRWYVTTTVAAYRDEEERSGYTPAWAPGPRASIEDPGRWLAAQLPVPSQRRREYAKVARLHRALAGYKHLVGLHILLRFLVLVVFLAGIVNWFGVLFLPIEIPAR